MVVAPSDSAPAGNSLLLDSRWNAMTASVIIWPTAAASRFAFVASPVALEESQIWTPEIELYSGAQSSYDLPRKDAIVYLFFSGGPKISLEVPVEHTGVW